MDFKYPQHIKHNAINLHYSSEADGQLSLPSICKGESEVQISFKTPRKSGLGH